MPDGNEADMPIRDILRKLGEVSLGEFDDNDEEGDEGDEKEKERPATALLDAIQVAANEGEPLPKVKTDGEDFFAVSA